jgi:HlyD family secretion protein
MTGTEMLRIANLNNMEVRVNVNENDIVRVSDNDKVIIDVDAYSATNKEFAGVITQIANTANGSGGANSTEAVTEFEVRINILPSSYQELLRKSKYPFKPGMTATVDIITESKNNVIAVPISAVTTRTEKDKKEGEEENKNGLGAVKEVVVSKDKPKEIVFVNEKGIARERVVKTGITDTEAGTIEILDGLKVGDIIISGPFVEVSQRLEDGSIITEKKKETKKEE